MKNIKKTIFRIFIIISFVLFLNACGKKKQLSFEVNGGNQISTVEINKNEEYELPTPTREGFEFNGWYLSSDFSGDSILTIKITDDTKVYAKWEQLYKITFDVQGGSLSTSYIYGKNGDTISELVKDYVPTKANQIFGAWYNGSQELNSSSKISSKDITLTAKYKNEYTINVYKEKLTHDGYDKDEIKLYEYVGKTVTYSLENEDGFIEVEKEDTVNEIVINENNSLNVLTLYYDRQLFTVTLRSNYPGIKEEETKTINLYYGEEIELPSVDFSYNGYYLLGFALSTQSEIVYNAHLIETLPVNKEDIKVTKDKISTDRTCSLYAIWNKGYKDMFGGDDIIFIDKDNDIAYLNRSGVYFVGEFDSLDNSFIFYNNKNLVGRIYDDGTFSYKNLERSEYSAVLYTVGDGLDGDRKLLFDAYNSVTFYDGKIEEADKRESKGSYTIDASGYYHITFTEGLKAGETMVVTIGKVSSNNVTTEAFQYRKDSEYNMGTLVRFGVYNNDIVIYQNNDKEYVYDIKLNGFGSLTYNNNGTTESYYYSYDEETKILEISNANESLGKFKIITHEGKTGYFYYDEEVNKTFNGENESTLVLDGLYNALYTNGDTSISGIYTYKQSVFGGYIVSFRHEGKEYTFKTSSKTEENVITGENQDETITNYFFETKPNGYNEYYYKGEESLYYAPLVVINDKEVGTASVYGYTASSTYELALEGTYVLDENTNLYIFTTTTTHNKKTLTDPIDLKTIKSFVFALDESTTQYSINYWYSSTTSTETTDYKVEYKNDDNSSIIIVNGVAILSKDGYVTTGFATTSNGITTISNTYTSVYVELNENKTFVVLDHAPYSVYVVNKDGSYSNKLYMTLNGKGGAKYVTINNENEEEVIEGLISKTENKTKNNIDIYSFTSVEKTFTYLLINNTFVCPIYDEFVDEYTSKDGILYLDGYLNYITYTDTEGVKTSGTYIIIDTNTIQAQFGKTVRYFDITDNTFTVKGIEYGTYAIVNNQSSNDTYVDLNGYLKATIYTLDSENTKTVIDSDASYSISDDKYTIKYKNNSEDITLIGYLITRKNANIFFIEELESVHTYIDKNNWSVLVLDSKGNAVRVDDKGNKDEGVYAIISDDLLYFVNDNETYANIYKYDKENSTITERKYSQKGYYTKDLKSLLFTEYGFAIFNDTTRYYYDVTSETVFVYRLDRNNPLANEYGYVKEDFGTFDDTKVYGGDTYYRINGFAINFTRNEETKDTYPVLVNATTNEKLPLSSFSFSPSGSDTFNIIGNLNVGELSLNCNVVKELVEDHYIMYIKVGYYRFDITVNFLGKDENDNGIGTFDVIGMSCVRELDPYKYLDYYYMYYFFYGEEYVSTYENNIGHISIIQNFDSTGEKTEDYVVIEFKDETKAIDLNGNLINTLNSSYTEDDNMFTVSIEGTDGYTYKIYFVTQTHRAFQTLAYRLYAVTRLETLTYNNYTVDVERIVASDYNVSMGTYYSFKLKENDTELTSKESFEYNDNIYYVARTFKELEESEIEYDAKGDLIEKPLKVLSTKYYKLNFESKSMELIETFAPYESATVEEVETTTYQTEDKTIYFDIMDSKIIFISIDGNKYLVSESSYNEETKEYTITLPSLMEYKVTLLEDGIATVTEITEEEIDENLESVTE